MLSFRNGLQLRCRTMLRHSLTVLLLETVVATTDAKPAPVAGASEISQDRVAVTKEVILQRATDYVVRFRKDDLGQAIRLFNRVIKKDPQDPKAHAGLAESHALRYLWGWDPNPGTLGKALESGRRAVDLGPDTAEAHVGLGIALIADNRYSPALAELDKSIELDSASYRAHFYRGMLLRNLRRTAEAKTEAERALELAPASAVGRALLGDCYQNRLQFAEARSAYLAAAELDQRLLWARLGIASAYQRETNFAAAEKAYLLIEKEFPEEAIRIRILSASLLVANQRYEDAVTLYQSVSEKETLSPPIFRRLMLAGRAYSLERLDRLEEAEYFWNQVVEEFPPDFDGGFRDREVASQAFEALSRIYAAKAEPHRSEKILERGCRNRGMPFSLYAALAERRRAAGRFGEAAASLRRGVLEAPPDEDWITATEKVLPTVRGVAATKVSPDTRSETLALLQDLSGRVSQASPPSYAAYLNLARGEALFRQIPEALEHLREAMRRGYGGIRHAATDPDFSGIADEPGFRELAGIP